MSSIAIQRMPRHTCALNIVAIVVAIASITACKDGGCSGRKRDAGAAGDGSTVTTDARAPVGRTYPAEVKSNATAVRLCDALHALPGKRKASCCDEAPTRFFADECVRVLSASLADEVVRVAEPSIDACAAAMAASLEGCLWVTPGQPLAPKECHGIIDGQVAEGGACRSHLDCKATLHCAGGTCIKPEGIGAMCGRGVDQLATHTGQFDFEKAHPICAEHCSMVAHKCEAMPAVGAQCFSHVNCAPGQLCVNNKCALGSPGKRDEACSSGTCEIGLRCLAATGKCVALATSGEACQSDFDCGKGGCTANGDAGARTCGMTCSHAADLPQLMKAIANPPTAVPRSSSAPSAPSAPRSR